MSGLRASLIESENHIIMHSNLLKYIFFAICIPALFIACDKRPTFTPGQGGSGGGGGNSGGADYSGLTTENHPRIIMTDADVAVIKEKLAAGTDENLTRLHESVIAYADKVLTMAPLEYKLVGKRLLDVCTAASNRIISCSYAWQLTGDDRYLKKAEEDLAKVASFPGWNAGGHDLDVGELTHGVGIGYDWLYNDLDEQTRKNVEKAISEFAFGPVLTYDIEGSTFYGQASNWNQVCNGGLVCCALAIYETNPDTCQEIIDRAVKSNGKAMEGMYSPDGNYPEGYGYWGYGTAFECILLSALETCVGTDFNLSRTEGFDQTGKWIMFMEGMNRRVFNYSDCGAGSTICPPLWYLAYKFNDSSILYYEVTKVKDGMYGSADPKYLPMAITYASKFNLNEIPAPATNTWRGAGINPVVLVHGDWTFSDTDKFLGIKGGQANYSHAQMDLGSFVYDAYGLRVSADLGLQSYGTLENLNMSGYSGGFGDYMSQNSFRWACFRYNNYNHSTLTINNALHKFNAKAPITNLINTPTSKGGVVDLSDALSAECASATRTVTIDNDRDLIVKDVIKALNDKAAEVRWTMVTMCPPEIESGRIVLQGKNRDLYLTVTSAKGAAIRLTSWPTKGEWYDADNSGYYEVGFTSSVSPGQQETFTVKITPDA